MLLEQPDVFSGLTEYLGVFAPDMAERMQLGLKPLFDPEKDSLSPEVAELIHAAMKPFPAQAVSVEGLVRCFNRRSVAWLVGEMGTGKTPMGLWVMLALHKQEGRPLRAVLTAPNQLVYKWAKHAETIIPGCRAVVVTRWDQLDELDNAPPPEKNEVWILPRDKGKLGYSWRLGLNMKLIRETVTRTVDGKEVTVKETRRIPVCPKCGKQVRDEKGNVLGLDYFIGKGDKLKGRRTCNNPIGRADKRGRPMVCGEQLWQANNGLTCFPPNRIYTDRPLGGSPEDELPRPGVAPRRMAPCSYLRGLHATFDLYIADEVHELKGCGTLQGQMFADLCLISDRILCMTGTLVGGYAENLLHLLWRTIPERLREDDMQHSEGGFQEFVRLYGVLLKETKIIAGAGEDHEDLALGRGKKSSSKTKCCPGISPLLFTSYMLDQTVFIRLMEMHSHLPQFDEYVHKVTMRGDQAAHLTKMSVAFDEHRRRMFALGQPCRAWSAARAAFLRWPDRPWPAKTVYDSDAFGNKFPAFEVTELPQDVEYPKELRLRRICRLEKARGRKVWVFTEMTGEQWDVTNRLADYLAKNGLRVAILRSQNDGGPAPEDRMEWIEQNTPNADVMICNPNLVKTGLDLFDFPTIVFYYCGDNTYTLRQAARRHWRLGQKQRCVVHYLTYHKRDWASPAPDYEDIPDNEGAFFGPADVDRYVCIQSAALSLMANKMGASLALEGDFSGDGLAALSDSTDVQSQLAKVIAGELQVEDVGTTFARYREKLKACLPDLATAVDVVSQDSSPHAMPEDMQSTADVEPVEADETAGDEHTQMERLIERVSKVDPAIAEQMRAQYAKVRAGVAKPPEPPAPASPEPLPSPAPVAPSPAPVVAPVAPPTPPPIAARAFERASQIVKAEPPEVGERKRLRFAAVSAVLGTPAQREGDIAKFGDAWVQVIAKDRKTVRDRNFERLSEVGGRKALIVFAEPPGSGATTGHNEVAVEGVTYHVSAMTLDQWLSGVRTPGKLKETA